MIFIRKIHMFDTNLQVFSLVAPYVWRKGSHLFLFLKNTLNFSRVKATSLVTLITPIKLNTISVQHVEFMHSIDLAVILRLMAFHYIVWMEELYKKLIQLLLMPLTGKIGKSTWWNIQVHQTTLTMCSSTKSQGLGAIKGNSGWKYTTMALADYWL